MQGKEKKDEKPSGRSGFDSPESKPVKRLLTPILYVLAAAYFLVDVIFLAIARPIANWFSNHWMLVRLRRWIAALGPYPALALFAFPVAVLEPVKPVAAYLAATGHMLAGLALLAIGEILKLVLVERLFSVVKPKLMTIAAFAWAYGKFRLAKDWLESSDAWQTVRRLGKLAVETARHYARDLRGSRTSRHIFWQSR
jgi:hypothetical protein